MITYFGVAIGCSASFTGLVSYDVLASEIATRSKTHPFIFPSLKNALPFVFSNSAFSAVMVVVEKACSTAAMARQIC